MYERLNEVLPEWKTAGIFYYLNINEVPWKDLNIVKSLDIAYHGGRSGDKLISPLVSKMLTPNESGDQVLDDENANILAKMLTDLYGKNWSKLWDTLNVSYNPIENYDAKETVTETTLRTGTVNNAGTENLTGNSDVDALVNGFNSTQAVPASSETGTGSSNTVTDTTETRDTRDEFTRTYDRHGNIGVTTSQQMLESERELWNWYFYDVVFTDIDKALTLLIY